MILFVIGASVFGAAPSTAAGPTTVRVASYNVDSAWREVSQPEIPRWDARLAGIKNVINAAKPDVIGIQEAPNITIGPRQYTQATDIRNATGYAMYQPANGTAEPNPILWRAGLFQLTAASYKIFEFKRYPDYGRAMTWVKLKSRSTGHSFFVFNTHFEAGAGGQAARNAEAVMLAAEIRRVNPGGLPAFVTGDFNDTSTNSAPQTARLNAIGYGDSYWMTGARMHPEFDTYNDYRRPRVGDYRIDQVYVGSATGFTVLYWENWTALGNQMVGGRPPSDHNMIYTVATFY